MDGIISWSDMGMIRKFLYDFKKNPASQDSHLVLSSLLLIL